MGSGCGTVGRAVASDTRGKGFVSSHQQILFSTCLLLTVINDKEAGDGAFEKIVSFRQIRFRRGSRKLQGRVEVGDVPARVRV